MSSQRLRIGKKRLFVTELVSTPTEYDLVQKRQYTGHTEVAKLMLPHEPSRIRERVAIQLTEKQSFVWIPMNYASDRRIVAFVQGIEF